MAEVAVRSAISPSALTRERGTQYVTSGDPAAARHASCRRWCAKPRARLPDDAIRKAIRESHKGSFRIVEFNVLGNHLHLIVEASGARELARGCSKPFARSHSMNASISTMEAI